MKEKKKSTQQTIDHAVNNYPGASSDKPDSDATVSNARVRQETHMLNNNPRNSNGPDADKRH
ncbi:MAG: hypothetical protein K2F91_05630 [Muribaculaceae bacterium]|nr:hypothetical protein [Muribaculaceae bacterium]